MEMEFSNRGGKIIEDLNKITIRTLESTERLISYNNSEKHAESSSKGGKVAGTQNWANGVGLAAMDPERRSELSRENGLKAQETLKENGSGFYGMTFDQRSEIGKKANITNKTNGTSIYGMSSKEKAEAGKKRVKAALKSGNHNSFKLKAAAAKRYMDVYDMMPDTFTAKDIKNILESINIAAHNTGSYKNYWLKNSMIEIMHHGKKGCNYDVNIFKKITG